MSMRALRTLVVVSACALLVLSGASTNAARAEAPTRRYQSRPDLKPPTVEILKHTKRTTPGYIFIAPKKDVVQAGPLILDNRGRVVWFLPLDTHGVTDFRVQRYHGRPVLTWWHGQPDKGSGKSGYSIYDDSYRLVAQLQPGNGMLGDIHEFKITPRNTALITISRQVRVKGRRILEGGIQELNIKTGRVLFEWHSIDHVQLVESYYSLPKDPGRIFDYFHVNSIEIDHDGNLLVSARNTHTIYKVSRRTGKILWRLGGRRSDFTLGRDVRFAWQHDLATRRPSPAGRRSDALRQLRRTAGSQAVARPCPAPGHEADARYRRPQLRPPAADRRSRPGKHATASRGRLLRRLGPPAALHGVRAAGDDPLRRSLRTRARGFVPRVSASLDRPALAARARCSRARPKRLRQLERRDGGVELAASSGPAEDRASPDP